MKKYFLRIALFFAFFNVWASENDPRDGLDKDAEAKANEGVSGENSSYYRRGQFAGGGFWMKNRIAAMSPTDIANTETLPSRRFAQNPQFQEMKKAAIEERKASFSEAEMDEYKKRVNELMAMDEDQKNAVREDLRNKRHENHKHRGRWDDNQNPQRMQHHAQRKQALLNACLPLLSDAEGNELKTLMGIQRDDLTNEQHERRHQLRDKCFSSMNPDQAESLRPKHRQWRAEASSNESRSSHPSDRQVRD
ncbi:MAG: hypothetical protein CNLJKLNK_00838 [Holosporales bacterium]